MVCVANKVIPDLGSSSRDFLPDFLSSTNSKFCVEWQNIFMTRKNVLSKPNEDPMSKKEVVLLYHIKN